MCAQILWAFICALIIYLIGNKKEALIIFLAVLLAAPSVELVKYFWKKLKKSNSAN